MAKRWVVMSASEGRIWSQEFESEAGVEACRLFLENKSIPLEVIEDWGRGEREESGVDIGRPGRPGRP